MMLSEIIEDAKKLFEAYKLKFTYRFTDRPIYKWEKESVAAHCWGMMITADYLLEKLEQYAPWKYNLDRSRIYSLITYHDLIEAETGDIDIDPKIGPDHDSKDTLEARAMKTYPQKLPKELRDRFLQMHAEYEKRETLESKFVKIVDIVECEFFIHHKKDFYENWSKEFYEEKRGPHFAAFPELQVFHEELVKFYDENNYF